MKKFRWLVSVWCRFLWKQTSGSRVVPISRTTTQQQVARLWNSVVRLYHNLLLLWSFCPPLLQHHGAQRWKSLDDWCQYGAASISRLNISEVVSGTKHDDIGVPYAESMFDYPKRANIFHQIESPSTFNLANVIYRILQNQKAFEAKFERKMKAESEFYKQLHAQ